MQQKESECLHCKVNEVVQAHMEGLKTSIDLPELVSQMAESLVDLILLGPEERWDCLLAEAMRHVGQRFLEKSGAIEADTIH